MRTKAAVPSRYWLGRLLPFAVGVGALFATLTLAEVLVRRELSQLEARTDAEAKHVAAQVRLGVNQAFEPLKGIAAWWTLHGPALAPEDWETDSSLFLRGTSGLGVVALMDVNGARIRAMVPEAVMDAPDTELRETIAAARRLNSTAVSRVFLVNGRPVFYACSPMRRQGRLSGFVAGRYDVTELLSAIARGQVPEDYSVVIKANGHEIRSDVRPLRSPWLQGARETNVAVANTWWVVRLTPSTGEVATLRYLVIGFGVLISLLLYACAAVALVARRRATELDSANQRLVTENQERRRAEERISELNRDLEHRLEDFRVLLEVLPIGIAVAEDSSCRKIWMNRSMSAMLKVALGENISKSAEDAGHLAYRLQYRGEDVPTENLPMQAAARTGTPVENQELDIVREDGSVLNTLSYAAPLFDENGQVRGVIDACVDITERKRAEEERRVFMARRRELEQRVQRAEKYRSLAGMAGGIAHDFNNMLTVIIGNANLLLLDLPQDSVLTTRVGELLSAADRAAKLTSRLMAFTGQIWCIVRPIDLGAELRSMEPALRAVIPAAVELKCDLEAELPPVRAASAEIQQAIECLVENAVEAIGGRPGRIEIRLNQCRLTGSDIERLYPDQQLTPGNYVRLELIDTGCGIPEENAGRVFDPFFTTKFLGRGLGLSAVQGIVRAHIGGIRLESSIPNGTRVEIVLPVEPRQESPEEASSRAITSSSPATPRLHTIH